MSETRATNPVFPPGRYGWRRSGRRRPLVPILLLAVVVAACLALSVRLYSQFGDSDYDAQIIGWKDPTPTTMIIQFSVRVPAGRAAFCVLRARDAAGNELGKREVVVRPSGNATSIEAAEPVTTTAQASVGDVLGCRAAE